MKSDPSFVYLASTSASFSTPAILKIYPSSEPIKIGRESICVGCSELKCMFYTYGNAVYCWDINKILPKMCIRDRNKALLQQASTLDIENEIIENEVKRIIWAEIARLSGDYRDIMAMSLEGYSTREISEELDLSEQTIKNKKGEALKLSLIHI